MRILLYFIKIIFFYLFLRFLFKAIFSFIRLARRKPNKYEKETVLNKEYQETEKKEFDDKDIVDAEFEEIE